MSHSKPPYASEQEAFLAYLDDPTNAEARAAAGDLVAMMEEVDALEDADPGQAYWNQFNHRLQQRLQAQPRTRRSLRTWFSQWQALPALAVMVLIAFIAWWPNHQRRPAPEIGQQLASMNDQELALIDDLFDTGYLDGNIGELADNDLALLFDAYPEETPSLEFEVDLPNEETFDSEAFKSLWNAEG